MYINNNVYCYFNLTQSSLVIEEGEFSDKDNEFNLTVLACLFSGASFPAMVYHKKVIEDYGQRFVDLSKKKLLFTDQNYYTSKQDLSRNFT